MLLIDENLSYRLKNSLRRTYPNIEHVDAVDLGNTADRIIWEYAKQHEYTILTKDNDFLHLLALYQHPPKVVRISSGNVTTRHITQLLIEHKTEVLAFINDQALGLLELY